MYAYSYQNTDQNIFNVRVIQYDAYEDRSQ
jgi:hypothetical protein